jgi:membrane-associated phospholipid phosphatase
MSPAGASTGKVPFVTARDGTGAPRAMTGTRPSRWGYLAVGAVGIVAVTAILAATGVLPGETALRTLVRGLSSSELRRLARTIRPLGTWWGLLPWLLLLLAAFAHARRRWWLWGAALIAAPLCGEALQELVGRNRPHGSALGFPSGHATAVAAFAVATVYLVGRSSLWPVVRAAISLGAVLLMLAIGLSRMILDAHWMLDVVAGFALGAAGAAAAAWWDASHPLPPAGASRTPHRA